MVDESLSPNVAKALGLVGYRTITRKEVTEWEGLAKVTDPMVIPWCAANNAVWIHADDNARREHAKLIIAKGICTLWIYRPRGMLTNKEQLLILSHVLPEFLARLESKPGRKHYNAYIHGQALKPRVRLTEAVM
jgi:hypothetical protein